MAAPCTQRSDAQLLDACHAQIDKVVADMMGRAAYRISTGQEADGHAIEALASLLELLNSAIAIQATKFEMAAAQGPEVREALAQIGAAA